MAPTLRTRSHYSGHLLLKSTRPSLPPPRLARHFLFPPVDIATGNVQDKDDFRHGFNAKTLRYLTMTLLMMTALHLHPHLPMHLPSHRPP